MTVDLVGFLRARLDEDEQVALGCVPASEQAALHKGAPLNRWKGDGSLITEGAVAQVGQTSPEAAAHITRHDPARVLAEVDAKRRIIGTHPISTNVIAPQPDTPALGFGCETCHDWSGYTEGLGYCDTLRLLALPYREHPDYRQEWAPEA